MIKVREYICYLSFGGLLCGGIAGLIFMRCPNLFPPNSTLESIMLISIFLGSAGHQLVNALLKPVLYYANLGQLVLLKRLIGEETQQQIIREITKVYFLGNNAEGKAFLPSDKKNGAIPRNYNKR
jgi:hypothetical protein